MAMAMELEKVIKSDSELLKEEMNQTPHDDAELEAQRQISIRSLRNGIHKNRVLYTEITKQTNSSLIQLSMAQMKRDQLRAQEQAKSERSKKPGFSAQN